MKIEIEIPDWAKERHLYLLAGIELVAYKDQESKDWFIKTERCNSCGKCCMNLVDDGQYTLDKNKNCIYLKADGEKWICSLGASRPLPCCEGDLEKNKENKDNLCCIRYKKA